MRRDNQLIRQVFHLVREMIILGDEGQAAAEDDGCGLLFGVLQDCAYKIRLAAERERTVHKRRGAWEEDGS